VLFATRRASKAEAKRQSVVETVGGISRFYGNAALSAKLAER
jgi:hypothetical protein